MASIVRLDGVRHGLTVGKLPKGATYIKHATDVLRRELEHEIVGLRGAVTLLEAAHIQSACRWERHALLCQRYLRLHAADMDHAMRLAYSREVARASSERDKALRELGLRRPDGASLIEALYRRGSQDEDADGPSDSEDVCDASRTQDTSTPAAGGGDGGEGLSRDAAETEHGNDSEGTQD